MGLCGVLSKDDFGSDLRERARGIRESLLEKGRPQGMQYTRGRALQAEGTGYANVQGCKGTCHSQGTMKCVCL